MHGEKGSNGKFYSHGRIKLLAPGDELVRGNRCFSRKWPIFLGIGPGKIRHKLAEGGYIPVWG